MSEIKATLVKELREMTGAGLLDCRKALEEAGGDIKKAQDILRTRGVKEKRLQRSTHEGAIGSYVHTNGKLATLVEVQCETDFAARSEIFQTLVKDLCMHVAGTPYPPLAIRREDVPAAAIEEERRLVFAEIDANEKDRKKPDNIKEKIVEGRMKRFYSERVLLEQPFVKDDTITIDQLVKNVINITGENVTVAWFIRRALGQE